mmetsp:Transcript_39064/g.103277  ORF Transcript_39064/g.103277 Transcript_39064/m.103277 type:complete len:260 (-) Transcript_39064:41-820(-)
MQIRQTCSRLFQRLGKTISTDTRPSAVEIAANSADVCIGKFCYELPEMSNAGEAGRDESEDLRDCDTFQLLSHFLDYLELTCPDWEYSANCINVADYLDQLCVNIQTSSKSKNFIDSVDFLLAATYLQRLSEYGVPFSHQSLRSLILVALMEACKFHEERSPRNSFWSVNAFRSRWFRRLIMFRRSAVGGFSLADVNLLERQFLAAIRFRLAVSPDDLTALLRDLTDFASLGPEERGGSAMARRFHLPPPRPLPASFSR